MARISRGAPAKGCPPKGSWGDRYVIENTNESKRVSCRHCVNYCEDDKSCNVMPFYVPENGYGYWKYCKKFLLSPEFNDSHFIDIVERVKGEKYIQHSNKNLQEDKKSATTNKKKKGNNENDSQKHAHEIQKLWDARHNFLRNIIYVCVSKKINFIDIWDKLHYQLDSKGRKKDDFPLIDEEVYRVFSEYLEIPFTKLYSDKAITNKMEKLLIKLLEDKSLFWLSEESWEYCPLMDEEEYPDDFWYGALDYWTTEHEYIRVALSNEQDGIFLSFVPHSLSNLLMDLYCEGIFYFKSEKLKRVFIDKLNDRLWSTHGKYDVSSTIKIGHNGTLISSPIYRCINNNHNADKQGVAIDIVLPDGKIITSSLYGTHCVKCGKTYALEKDIDELNEMGVLLCEIDKEDLNEHLDTKSLDYEYLLIQQKLERYGYIVGNNNKKLTDVQRTIILDNIVKNKVESPNNLVNFLNWLITKSISESNYSYVPNGILDEWRYDREYLKSHELYKIPQKWTTKKK